MSAAGSMTITCPAAQVARKINTNGSHVPGMLSNIARPLHARRDHTVAMPIKAAIGARIHSH